MVSSYFTSTASLNNVVVLLLLLFASIRVAEATVYIPESQLSYQSMPALFGRFWPHDVTYWAHLQMIPSRPYLCPMEFETKAKEEEEEVYFEDEDYYYGNDNNINNNNNKTKVEGDDANTSLDDDVTIPSDGMPIVLLAKRGKCTFYEKSIVASQYKHVDFLIVYDDDPSNNKLIPMTISNSFDSTTTGSDELSSNPNPNPNQNPNPNPNPKNSHHHQQQHNHSTIDNQLSSRNHNHHQQHPPPQRHSHLGLLFVSYHTGIELQDIILKRLNDPPYSKYKNYSSHSIRHDDEGIVIQMDGNAPPLVGYQSGFGPGSSVSSSSQLTMEGYLWAGTLGFVAFLVFFACALLCANVGIIHATTDEFGRLVLITGARRNNGADQGLSVKTLLTKDDVLSLDFETYNQQEEPSNDKNNDQQDENDQGQDTMMNIDDSPFCCAICLDDEFSEGETIRILPCGHKFHDDCVIPWLTERSPSCPLCKFDVLKHLESPAIEKQHHSTTTLSANITNEEEAATVTTEQEQEGDAGIDESEDDSQEIASDDDARNCSTTIWDYFISFSSSTRFDGGGWTLLRNVTGRIPQDDDGSDNSNLENDNPSEIEMLGTISIITTTTNSSRIPSFPFASNV